MIWILPVNASFALIVPKVLELQQSLVGRFVVYLQEGGYLNDCCLLLVKPMKMNSFLVQSSILTASIVVPWRSFTLRCEARSR